MRQYQPPTLIVWGKNDQGFLVEGAYAYKRDLKNLEFHLYDTGHFALEEDGDAICASPKGRRQGQTQQRFAIADHIRRFLTTHVVENTKLTTSNK
ncbi:alpha/beta fold hydrolase [Tolypothrix sp. NIES-4075]|uniref:alpha/beta fold hydrolase n=1 Tax=Tolypothrix sp. NIES-4075 TaxID=2005459 RepID=UPI001F376DC7|nr:alpha/beta hydrolase [Tolypothrix sp. NIES-4075]